MGLPLRFDERRKERLIAVSFLGALFDLSNKGRARLALSSPTVDRLEGERPTAGSDEGRRKRPSTIWKQNAEKLIKPLLTNRNP